MAALTQSQREIETATLKEVMAKLEEALKLSLELERKDEQNG